MNLNSQSKFTNANNVRQNSKTIFYIKMLQSNVTNTKYEKKKKTRENNRSVAAHSTAVTKVTNNLKEHKDNLLPKSQFCERINVSFRECENIFYTYLIE